MRFPLLSILLAGLLLVPLFPLVSASYHAPSGDWHVTEDTHLRSRVMHVQGDVTVDSGITLTLEASTVYVGGLLHVRPNATLELLPRGSGSPSRLLSHPDGDGFWINIEGKMVSRGSGAEVRGLWGNGLTATLPGNLGGMKITGSADLEGIRIHDGTAGVFVAEGGAAVLRNSTVEHLGEAGLTVLGGLRLEETTVADNEINLVAKDTCDIHIEDSLFLDAAFEQLLINGCKAEVHRSVLDGGGVGVVGNNAAGILLEDSIVKGYAIDGLGSYASPDPAGGMLRPTIRFHNVTMEPGPGAERGADLMGNELVEFVNVTLHGHASHGIQASQATLSIRDSAITGNGGYGIRLAAGRFLEDPLAAGNRFGSGPGTDNAQGAVSHVALVEFVVVKQAGDLFVPQEGEVNVTVRSADGRPVHLIGHQAKGPGTTQVAFETYLEGPDEGIRFIGPFTYQAIHPVRDDAFVGDIAPDEGLIALVVEETLLEKAGAVVVRGLSPLLFAVGAVLVLVGARVSVWPRISERLRVGEEQAVETDEEE